MQQELKLKKRKRISRFYQLIESEKESSYGNSEIYPEKELVLYRILLNKVSKPRIVRKELSNRFILKTSNMIKPYPISVTKESTPEEKVKRKTLQSSKWEEVVQQVRKTIKLHPINLIINKNPSVVAKTLSSNLSDELHRYYSKLESKLERTIEKPVEEIIKKASIESMGSQKEYLEMLYGLKPFLGMDRLLTMDWSKPKIIIAYKPEDNRLSYIEFLIILLRDLYRIHKGGLPITRYISSSKELDDIWPLLKASNSIVVLDYEKIREEDRWPLIRDRLKEMLTQDFGFYVFYVSDDHVNELQTVLFRDATYYKNDPEIIEIKINNKEHLLKMLQNYIGFEPPIIINNNIGVTARNLENMYHEVLRRSLNNDRVMYILKLHSDKEAESTEHLLLKATVLKILLDEYKYGVKELACEEELGDKVIDICVKKTGRCSIAIEIETLYGTKIPTLKIRDDITTRCSDPSIEELWIILPNYAMYLYGKKLISFIDNYYKYFKENERLYCKKIKVGVIKINTEKKINKDMSPKLEILYEVDTTSS